MSRENFLTRLTLPLEQLRFFLSVYTLRENDMATEDEEFDEGVFDNDEDDVGAIERSADPRRIIRRIRLPRRIRCRRASRIPRFRRRARRVRGRIHG